MKKDCWNYRVWKSFNQKIYKECITQENLVDGGKLDFFERVWRVDSLGGQNKLIPCNLGDFFVTATKGNESFLINSLYVKNLPIKITASFPVLLDVKKTKVFHCVTDVKEIPLTANITPTTTFKEFVNNWNPLKHTNEQDWTFLKLVSLATQYKGIKICLCSEPRSGKNSNYTILNHIFGDVFRIQKPTLAKLETSLFYNKVVLPDEISSLEPSKVREIEPMVLSLGDNSTEYNKHSMATDKRMNIVDVTHKSVVFTYNRPQDLNKKGAHFFEQVWSNIGALKDRYPMFLLSGQVIETMPNLSADQADKLVVENFEDMRVIVKDLVYWSSHIHLNMNHWKRTMITLSNRHMPNLEGLLDVLDVYCESQDEYDNWLLYMVVKMCDYSAMVNDALESESLNNKVETTEELQEKINIVKYAR